jgi:hypothetical protein
VPLLLALHLHLRLLLMQVVVPILRVFVYALWLPPLRLLDLLLLALLQELLLELALGPPLLLLGVVMSWLCLLLAWLNCCSPPVASSWQFGLGAGSKLVLAGTSAWSAVVSRFAWPLKADLLAPALTRLCHSQG